MQKIAAIDAGSNAMRMIVGTINEAWQVEPLENIRLPVRLGRDVFTDGAFQEKTIHQAVEAFVHFQRIARDFGVVKTRAIATSAVREASNADILLDRIARTAGVEVEVISGAEEARLIHLAVANALKLKGKRAVLIDIGGGSVEVTLSEDGNILSTESYNMGTVRLLEKLDGSSDLPLHAIRGKHPLSLFVREYAESARRRIDREIGDAHIDLCVGTGGNVEDLGRLGQRLLKGSDAAAIAVRDLERLIEKISAMGIKERITKLRLRPDRADVILPAAIVLQIIAHEARVRRITIPGVGLKDGVLLEMAERLRTGPHIPRREQVWQSALQLGKKYAIDAAHRLGLPSLWNPRESEPWQEYFRQFPEAVAARALGCYRLAYRVIYVAQATAAQVTGLSPDKVQVHNHLIGGGFGRRLDVDGITQMATMSLASC